jgi:hypothetical protein
MLAERLTIKNKSAQLAAQLRTNQWFFMEHLLLSTSALQPGSKFNVSIRMCISIFAGDFFSNGR